MFGCRDFPLFRWVYNVCYQVLAISKGGRRECHNQCALDESQYGWLAINCVDYVITYCIFNAFQ